MLIYWKKKHKKNKILIKKKSYIKFKFYKE